MPTLRKRLFRDGEYALYNIDGHRVTVKIVESEVSEGEWFFRVTEEKGKLPDRIKRQKDGSAWLCEWEMGKMNQPTLAEQGRKPKGRSLVLVNRR